VIVRERDLLKQPWTCVRMSCRDESWRYWDTIRRRAASDAGLLVGAYIGARIDRSPASDRDEDTRSRA